MVQRIRLETLPRLDDIRSECEDLEFLEVVSPEDQIHPFFEFCDSLLSQFGDDQDTAEWIDQQVSLAWNWVHENEVQWPDESEQHYEEIELMDGSESSRSVFEDIDADEEFEAK